MAESFRAGDLLQERVGLRSWPEWWKFLVDFGAGIGHPAGYSSRVVHDEPGNLGQTAQGALRFGGMWSETSGNQVSARSPPVEGVRSSSLLRVRSTYLTLGGTPMTDSTSTSLVAADEHGEYVKHVNYLAEVFGQVSNAVASGSHHAAAVPEFTAALAGGQFPASAQWRQLVYAVLAVHPHPDARFVLAVTGPLGVLRALVHDPDPKVRFGVLHNPLVVDADLQATLAADPAAEVVVGLLERVSPTAEVCRIVMEGPHPEPRRALARLRIGSERLKALADDSDLVTRCIARARLDARGELGAGVDR